MRGKKQEMVLRDYQQDILSDVEANEVFGADKMIVSLCTGGGKSLVISSLCNQYPDDRIVILTSITKLVAQIADHLDEVGIEYSILKAGMEDKFDAAKRVQLVMEQTLHARDHIDLAADIIIKDEGHLGWNGDRYKNIVKSSGCDTEILFSATPYDQSGVVLDGYEIIQGLNTSEATAQGYLTPADTYIAKFTKDVDFSDIGASGDYSANELDGVINNDSYNEAVVEAYRKLPKRERRSICFVSSVSHSDDLAAKFNELGCKAKSVHSKNSEEARFESEGLIPEDDYEVIVSVNKIAIGFDDTSINTVINCRPTKIKSLYYQMIGRGLRLHEGKDVVDILDCAKATLEHGFYDQVFVPAANKVEAKKTHKSMQLSVIDYIIGQDDAEEVVRVNLSEVEAAKKSLEGDSSIEGLKAKFELCNDIRELLDLLELIAPIASSHKFSKNFVAPEVIEYVDMGGSFKAIKTRANNILKQGKKLNALKFFPEWLREQSWGR